MENGRNSKKKESGTAVSLPQGKEKGSGRCQQPSFGARIEKSAKKAHGEHKRWKRCEQPRKGEPSEMKRWEQREGGTRDKGGGHCTRGKDDDRNHR